MKMEVTNIERMVISKLRAGVDMVITHDGNKVRIREMRGVLTMYAKEELKSEADEDRN